MNVLVVYDFNGIIWNIVQGDEIKKPEGVPSLFVNIPTGHALLRIDVSDSENPKPVFYQDDTDVKNREDLDLLMKATSFAAASFTDEQALQVPDLYETWSGDGKPYKTGARLNYDGILYRVLQDHTSQVSWTPGTAPSLYAKVLITDPNVIPAWEQPESTNGYAKGDRVAHNGKTWESLADNNVWEPGATGSESLWKEV